MGRARQLIGILVAAASVLLGACHHSGSGGATLIRHHAGSPAAGGVDQGPSDLVSAVSLGGGAEGPVSLKFQLLQRPVAGQPVTMLLRLLANQPTNRLEARFHTEDGLDIQQGDDFDPDTHLEAGAAMDHSLTLLAAHEGVYTVMATVTSGGGADAYSRSFVIPIVVDPPGAAPDRAQKSH